MLTAHIHVLLSKTSRKTKPEKLIWHVCRCASIFIQPFTLFTKSAYFSATHTCVNSWTWDYFLCVRRVCVTSASTKQSVDEFAICFMRFCARSLYRSMWNMAKKLKQSFKNKKLSWCSFWTTFDYIIKSFAIHCERMITWILNMEYWIEKSMTHFWQHLILSLEMLIGNFSCRK